ncbi:MAG TPA: aspartate kinase [Pseudogracilibacillus sp.]|nr:aspartate kinase [Pseudogracilibacillus sp.]
MRLLVQKFGGTSVQTSENRKFVIQKIKEAIEEQYKVVVVVSALGRNPDPYATDTLVSLVDEPKTANEKRELDLLMSCGEVISSTVLANELRREQINAIALTGAQAGLITTNDFTEAKIRQVKPERVKQELKTVDVVVIAGFQGRTEDGDMTTIGRGGSDTSAAAFGATLQAEYVDIFTDVDGIMTADPRVVESAQAIDVVTYTEIANLAHQGAKVVHPRAVEIAMQAEIPLRIRSTYSDKYGTLITASRADYVGVDIPDRLVTGIAHIEDISQMKISVPESEHDAPAKVFTAMADADISVDFITITPTEITYTVPNKLASYAVELLSEFQYGVTVLPDCAKVSAVGAGMAGIPGVAAKITKALAKEGVQILQSADSHTTIWVLVKESEVKKAVNALHEAFELNKLNEAKQS